MAVVRKDIIFLAGEEVLSLTPHVQVFTEEFIEVDESSHFAFASNYLSLSTIGIPCNINRDEPQLETKQKISS